MKAWGMVAISSNLCILLLEKVVLSANGWLSGSWHGIWNSSKIMTLILSFGPEGKQGDLTVSHHHHLCTKGPGNVSMVIEICSDMTLSDMTLSVCSISVHYIGMIVVWYYCDIIMWATWPFWHDSVYQCLLLYRWIGYSAKVSKFTKTKVFYYKLH